MFIFDENENLIREEKSISENGVWRFNINREDIDKRRLYKFSAYQFYSNEEGYLDIDFTDPYSISTTKNSSYSDSLTSVMMI